MPLFRYSNRHHYAGARTPESMEGHTREVFCNDPSCDMALRLNYCSNAISTTKYTVANCVPKSLFEQFRRVANVFFLVVACVSFSPLASYRAVSIALPLFFVISATMAKEAVEDWRRKQQDGEAYAHLLNVLAPEHCSLDILDSVI